MKFNLSIDLGPYTEDILSMADVARALRDVADRLAKQATKPWDPHANAGTNQGEIYLKRPRQPPRVVGTWRVDADGPTPPCMVTAANDPDSRVHCARCGEHIRLETLVAGHDLCTGCDGALP